MIARTMLMRGAPLVAAFVVPAFVGVAGSAARLHELRLPLVDPPAEAEALPPLPAHDPTRPTAVVLFSARATEITDALAPYGILAETGGLNVYAVAPERRPVAIYNGMQVPAGLEVVPHLGFEEYEAVVGRAPEIMVIPYFPGWSSGTDDDVVAWIRANVGPQTRVVTVCAGTEILAATGLLDGHQATSNPYWLDRLGERHPEVRWISRRRYVADGRMFTSTTLTSGIDATLAAAADVLGRAAAEDAGRRLGYRHLHFLDDPVADPPSLSLTSVPDAAFRLRGERVGMPLEEGDDEIAVAAVLDLEAAGLNRTVTVSDGGGVVTSLRGLHFRPGASAPALSAMDRVVDVPSTPGVFPYDAVVRNLAERRGTWVASSVSRSFAYPPPPYQGGEPALPLAWLWVVMWGFAGAAITRAWLRRTRA